MLLYSLILKDMFSKNKDATLHNDQIKKIQH